MYTLIDMAAEKRVGYKVRYHAEDIEDFRHVMPHNFDYIAGVVERQGSWTGTHSFYKIIKHDHDRRGS